LENIHPIEVGHDSSLTANFRKSVGTPLDMRAFYQLISESLVAALVKNVDGKGDETWVFHSYPFVGSV